MLSNFKKGYSGTSNLITESKNIFQKSSPILSFCLFEVLSFLHFASCPL